MSADLLMRKAATISGCGTYRYLLCRQWDEAAGVMVFIMLNPSTADAAEDDPTIRRCMGFARRERLGGIAVVNLFALRATDPAQLRSHPSPHGPENGDWLRGACMSAATLGNPIVAAWGVHGAGHAPAWLMESAHIRAALRCLGRTKGGHPRHPLYVRADQPLEDFA